MASFTTDGTGIPGSIATRSSREMEFSIARLAGVFIRLGTRVLDLSTTTDIITTTLAQIFTAGARVRTMAQAGTVAVSTEDADSPAAGASAAEQVVGFTEEVSRAGDSMAAGLVEVAMVVAAVSAVGVATAEDDVTMEFRAKIGERSRICFRVSIRAGEGEK